MSLQLLYYNKTSIIMYKRPNLGHKILLDFNYIPKLGLLPLNNYKNITLFS